MKINGKHIDECTKAEINNYFRERDDSHLYPIYGKFNATERAIRRLRKLDCSLAGLEYFYCLDAEISNIVNSVN